MHRAQFPDQQKSKDQKCNYIYVQDIDVLTAFTAHIRAIEPILFVMVTSVALAMSSRLA
jgi:hypothetical protein